MRLKFIAAIEILATSENQRSSQRGICLDADNPVAFDTIPTRAVRAKWNPVRVVAANTKSQIHCENLIQKPTYNSTKITQLNTHCINENDHADPWNVNGRDTDQENQTKSEAETRWWHELFIRHDDPNGARNIHSPCSDVRYSRWLLLVLCLLHRLSLIWIRNWKCEIWNQNQLVLPQSDPDESDISKKWWNQNRITPFSFFREEKPKCTKHRETRISLSVYRLP